MSRYRIRSPRKWLASAVTATALLAAACGQAREEPEAPGEPAARSEPVRVLNTVPPFVLVSQDGARFGSPDLAGKVWIATFIFTRCEQTCPMQTAELVRIQERLASHPSRGDVRLVSFSVDPSHDTPGVLKDYAREQGGDLSWWTYLTGEKAQLLALSRNGFRLPVTEPGTDGVIAHSQSFVLVDRARRVRGHYDALDEKARERLLSDLDLVLQDPPGPITERRQAPLEGIHGPRFYDPPGVESSPWMKDREAAQRRTVPEFEVFHGFRFTDRLPESGITFVNRVVDDGGKNYKGVHYDHGNGVAVADVDGDGLTDVYFVNQLGTNGLFRNRGDGTFEDVTKAAGVGVGDRVCVTASFADVDNDGDADLYVTAVRKGNLLFENDGKGRFRDATRASGLGYEGHSSSAVFFDYDKDGLVDLFLVNVGRYTTDEIGAGGYHVGYKDGFSGHLHPERSEQSFLFRNAGKGRFEDVSKATGLVHSGWSGAASPLDGNEDGWPDLYVLSMQGHDEYYENAAGKTFVRKSREVFPATPWGAMGIKVFDFDNDGRMDVYVTDMHTDMIDDVQGLARFWYADDMKMTERFPERYLATDGNHVMGNAFFRAEGGGRFEEISDRIGAENYWPWGLSVGDLNADGWEDAFIASSMNFPYRYQVNSVLLNDNGERFLDAEFILGVEPRREGRRAAHWFDLDCDGADRAHAGCKGLSGKIEVWGALGSRSSAIFDIEGDGDLDVVTNDFNSEPLVLVSDLAERKPDLRWLGVRLVGTKSTRDGLGARVTVRAGGRTWVKVHDGQSGYLSQSLVPLYFGLGAAAAADGIEVAWPSSGVQQVPGPVAANQVLTITEP